MANFEGLIRGAIAAKRATTPEARLEVYQSSRSALYRLIEGNRTLTVESAMQEQKSLEDAIARVEAECVGVARTEVIEPQYSEPVERPPVAGVQIEPEIPLESDAEFPNPVMPGPAIVEEPGPVAEVVSENEVQQPSAGIDDDPLAELKEILLDRADDEVRGSLGVEEVNPSLSVLPDASQSAAAALELGSYEGEVTNLEIPQPLESGAAEAAVSGEVSPAIIEEAPAVPPSYDEKENMPLEFARRRKKQKFIGWFLAVLVILALVGGLAYYIYTGVVSGTLFGLINSRPAQNPNALSNQATAANYITIVEPGDLSALITANRGQAELVNELNLEMVRIVSVRSDDDRSKAARPILFRLKPGVLEQISGKNVTFEIYAKSATPNPAQFTVKCQFGALGNCGRKRFRVGLQPEASIFAFDLGEVVDPEMKAYIAISTDTAAVAATTGKGDVIDIVYARLRANN